MCLLHFVFLTILTVAQSIATSGQSEDSSNAVDSLIDLQNATLQSDFPDSAFCAVPSIGAAFLPVDPTLVAVLFLMAEMSYIDQNESVAGQTWVAPGNPEVAIVTETSIQAKYLLWGAFAGIEYMIKNKRFHEMLLVLKFDSKRVGKMWIVPPSKPLLDFAPNTTASQKLKQRSNHVWANNNSTGVSASLASPNVVNNATSLGETVQVRIDSLPNGVRLTRFDVFTVCYAALVHLSRVKPDSQMEDFVSRAPLNDVFMYLFQSYPSLKIHQVIQIMTYLPRFMLDSPQGFREVMFLLEVDGTRILEGSINKGARRSGVSDVRNSVNAVE